MIDSHKNVDWFTALKSSSPRNALVHDVDDWHVDIENALYIYVYIYKTTVAQL